MFKKPFSFEGRIRRSEYGFTTFITFFVYLFAIVLAEDGIEIGYLLLIPLYWFAFAQGAKRCHDLGVSGWWQLIPFYFFILIFQDGQPGANKYGESPKEVTNIILKNNVYDNKQINVSDVSKSIEIPDFCPHCKNPNTKRIRLCEWCGGNIC